MALLKPFLYCFLLSSFTLFSADIKTSAATSSPNTPSIKTSPVAAPSTSSSTPSSTLTTPSSSAKLTANQVKTSEALYVSEVIDNGAFIILSDDSVWEVNPRDSSMASIWMFGADITLQKSQDPEYTYILENIRSHAKVRVKPSTQEELNLRIEKSFQSAPNNGSLEEPDYFPSKPSVTPKPAE